jgi:general secretion pathway protein F
MPAYAYQGVTVKGRAIKGVATSDNVGTLKATLKREGVFLTAVNETNSPGSSAKRSDGGGRELDLSGLFDRVNPKMIAGTTRLLGTLLHAGVTLPESLKAMTDQVESQRLKSILSDVAVRVNEGSSFADSLARYPKVFPQLYLNMVRAGEASGALETVLYRLAEFLEKQIEISGRVSKALMYPIVLAVLGAVIVTVLMVSIVPKITGMFADMQAELPWNTKLLIFMSDFISSFWWLILIAMVFGAWLFRRWRATEDGRWAGDRFLLAVPVVGDLIRKIAIARLARTLSTLLASGVQLLGALDIVRTLLGNAVLEKVVSDARDSIREGEGIANALKRSKQFPPLVTHMIAVGERSGQLEQMLVDLADAYDRETNQTIDKFTTLLEPLTIVLMGGAVGFVIYSIMGPIMMITEMAGKT